MDATMKEMLRNEIELAFYQTARNRDESALKALAIRWSFMSEPAHFEAVLDEKVGDMIRDEKLGEQRQRSRRRCGNV